MAAIFSDVRIIWILTVITVHIFSIGPENGEVQTTQSLILSQMVRRVREATSRLGSEHKDLHSAVSKVGKAIDRVNSLYQVELLILFIKDVLRVHIMFKKYY